MVSSSTKVARSHTEQNLSSFSKRAIDGCEDIVQARSELVDSKLAEYNAQDKPVNFTRMWDAFSCDVIMEYSYGFSYENLESEDFSETFHDAFLGLTEFGGLGCQFPFLMNFMQSLPDKLVGILNPPMARVVELLNVSHSKSFRRCSN